MSAIATQTIYSAPYVYARPVHMPARARAATLEGVGRHHATATAATASVSTGSSAQGLALAAIGDALTAPAAISNALATADDRLSQIGDLLAGGNVPAAAIDEIVSTATFGGKPLLDGSFTATLSQQSLSLPSFRAADLPAVALDQVTRVRSQIKGFQSGVIRAAVSALRAAAENLVQNGPGVDDASSAATAGLLVRAKVVVRGGDVARTTGARAENVLSLIR